MEKIHLSDAEWEIMMLLWEKKALTIRQMELVFQESRGWDKHTIITLLNRIEKKGGIAYRRQGRAKEYYPLVEQEDITLQESQKFLEKVYGGSLSMMLNSFLQQDSLSKKEIDELYQILKDAEKKVK